MSEDQLIRLIKLLDPFQWPEEKHIVFDHNTYEQFNWLMEENKKDK